MSALGLFLALVPCAMAAPRSQASPLAPLVSAVGREPLLQSGLQRALSSLPQPAKIDRLSLAALDSESHIDASQALDSELANAQASRILAALIAAPGRFIGHEGPALRSLLGDEGARKVGAAAGALRSRWWSPRTQLLLRRLRRETDLTDASGNERWADSLSRLFDEARSFPVQRLYRAVRVTTDDEGRLTYPSGSKAFVLWRERTPLGIPDGRFSAHYSDRGIVASALSLQTEQALVESDSIQIKPDPNSSLSTAWFPRSLRMKGFRIHGDDVDPGDDKWRAKFLLLQRGDDNAIVLFERYLHDSAARIVMRKLPHSRVRSSGFMEAVYSRSGRLKRIFFDNFGTYNPRSQWAPRQERLLIELIRQMHGASSKTNVTLQLTQSFTDKFAPIKRQPLGLWESELKLSADKESGSQGAALGLAMASVKTLAAARQDDFAIERYYPGVRIALDERGWPIIPRGSRAFLLWRERTPPWTPDGAFLAHYRK
ncbi:MAG: hypothetical protein KGO96_02795 [Elusimicrobia bacterium]|nr:hypothetical protein [Elusimicrobiota bacterium]MDE2424821.1 hypothetical protein [Elusimicrobiota bacterium]